MIDAISASRCRASPQTSLPSQWNSSPIVQQTVGQAFAAGAPPEDEDAAAEETGTRRRHDDGMAAKPGAVEEDRLGRQVFEPGVAPRPKEIWLISVVAPVER